MSVEAVVCRQLLLIVAIIAFDGNYQEYEANKRKRLGE
jgi:hypothetical protein